MLEPYYEVQVLLPFDCIKTIINILESRRCIITNDHFQEGTIYYLILGYIPIIETIGLETDLRYHTQVFNIIIGSITNSIFNERF